MEACIGGKGCCMQRHAMPNLLHACPHVCSSLPALWCW
jgi:hypothetical protein